MRPSAAHVLEVEQLDGRTNGVDVDEASVNIGVEQTVNPVEVEEASLDHVMMESFTTAVPLGPVAPEYAMVPPTPGMVSLSQQDSVEKADAVRLRLADARKLHRSLLA